MKFRLCVQFFKRCYYEHSFVDCLRVRVDDDAVCLCRAPQTRTQKGAVYGAAGGAAAGAIVGSLSGQDDSYRLWGKQAQGRE